MDAEIGFSSVSRSFVRRSISIITFVNCHMLPCKYVLYMSCKNIAIQLNTVLILPILWGTTYIPQEIQTFGNFQN